MLQSLQVLERGSWLQRQSGGVSSELGVTLNCNPWHRPLLCEWGPHKIQGDCPGRSQGSVGFGDSRQSYLPEAEIGHRLSELGAQPEAMEMEVIEHFSLTAH